MANKPKRNKIQKAKLILIIVSAFFMLLFIGFYIFRDMLLQKAMVEVSARMERDYDSKFTVNRAKFEGFTEVSMHDVSLVPNKADTLFRIETIKTKVSFWNLFTGNVQLSSLTARNGFVQLVKNRNGRNFDAFLPKKKDTLAVAKKVNYADLAYRTLTKAFNLVPTEMNLDSLTLRLDDTGKKATLSLNKLVLLDKQMETSVRVQTNTFNQQWKIKGFVDPRNNQADIRIFNIDTGKIKVPYFDERYNIKASFDSIRLNVAGMDMDGEELHFDGFTSVYNFTVNHPKIASKDVIIKNAQFEYHLLFDEHSIAVDSSSTVLLNSMKFHPYAQYSNEKDKIYKLKIAIPKMKAQDFINSLPKGLFTHFEGMEAEGTFDYQLDFMFNKNRPKDLIFESTLHKDKLKIIKYGEANLSKLNGPFVYRAIINDVPQRAIVVGPSNPNYAPLNQISPYLRKAVLTTEDPSFFSHKGFINEAFKQSIVKNIKTGKFSRGGSTITMQLIKNVFLTREKTLSRKLEEILLVYILENNRIVSKERMLEVYFNIIEWGPNVYGIGEAAQFYFQKQPYELTINECLFLANIIPSPRKFMYQFNSEGNLKPYAASRDKHIERLMLGRGILTSEDTIYQMPIMVTGRARSYIKTKPEPVKEMEGNSMEEFDF